MDGRKGSSFFKTVNNRLGAARFPHGLKRISSVIRDFLEELLWILLLEELSLHSCKAFWYPKKMRVTAYEKFKLLSVTGGVPLYLEQIRPELFCRAKYSKLLFIKGSLLVREFDEIFSDLFSRSKTSQKEIVTCLTNGPKELTQICKELGKFQGGLYSKYLDELIKAGFVKRDFTWYLKNGKEGKLSYYRLSDNYLRFYLKCIAPNRSKIEKGAIPASILNSLLGWESIMGLQFENLVIHNCKTLWNILNISMNLSCIEYKFLLCCMVFFLF
ncbi:MAG: hypothetical protein C5B45_01855 [Chlamydiae bacterium]|nr:MAG: hypothetical protein C5B45_01855 [Chlamydiota bacterium]